MIFFLNLVSKTILQHLFSIEKTKSQLNISLFFLLLKLVLKQFEKLLLK